MNHQIGPSQIADCIAQMREAGPHIHCITNTVAQTFTANILLAIGATPSMTIAESEIEDFVGMADGLLVNLGTLDQPRKQAIKTAVTTANRTDTSWGLDPVFVQASPERLELARTLLSHRPSLVRSNAREFAALFDSQFTKNAVAEHANTLETMIAVTGAQDLIAGSGSMVELENGTPLMDQVTAMGCALTAVMLAFMVLEKNPLLATVCGITLFNIAGELAAQNAPGPGSFATSFIDHLATITENQIEERVRLS